MMKSNTMMRKSNTMMRKSNTITNLAFIFVIIVLGSAALIIWYINREGLHMIKADAFDASDVKRTIHIVVLAMNDVKNYQPMMPYGPDFIVVTYSDESHERLHNNTDETGKNGSDFIFSNIGPGASTKQEVIRFAMIGLVPLSQRYILWIRKKPMTVNELRSAEVLMGRQEFLMN